MIDCSNYSVLKVSPMAQRTIYCYGKSFVTGPAFADNSNVVIVSPVPFCQFHCSTDCLAEFYSRTITIKIRQQCSTGITHNFLECCFCQVFTAIHNITYYTCKYSCRKIAQRVLMCNGSTVARNVYCLLSTSHPT